MKKFLSLITLLLAVSSGMAQVQSNAGTYQTATKATWTTGASFFAIAGQAGSKNWASGNDLFSFSANAFVNAHANLSKDKWYFDNTLIASYGLINTDEFSTIKNDDKLDIFSTLGIQLNEGKHIGLAAALNFRTQFSNGYDRDYLNQGLKRRTSGFFAPAYLTLAPVGLYYKSEGFEAYGTLIGFRGVIVSNEPYSYVFQGGIIPSNMVNEKNRARVERSVATMYGVDPQKTIQYQVGPYISASYNHEICHNIFYKGRLDLFSDFTNKNSGNIDLFSINTFVFKVNRWLSALYSLDVAYDDDIKKFGYYKDHAAFQSKSILGIGINTRFGSDRIKKHGEYGQRD